VDQPFPEVETNLLNKILTGINLSKYSTFDKDDVRQEVLIWCCENLVKWNELRDKSTSTTLMYRALKNRVLTILEKDLKNTDLYRHSIEEIRDEIIRQLRLKDGAIYDEYCSTSDKEQVFLSEHYSVVRTINRRTMKTLLNMTDREMKVASAKLIKIARRNLSYNSLVRMEDQYNV
jgi:hypothetical protein